MYLIYEDCIQMSKNVDQLIEMALDFDEIGIEEPFDPELHRNIIGQRVRVYLATTNTQFWSIIENGITGIQHSKVNDKFKATIFFRQLLAHDKARSMAYEEKSESMILVCEKKVVRAFNPGDSPMAKFVASAGILPANLIDPHISPRDIVGVVFPSASNAVPYPIRKFVHDAKLGFYEDQGIPVPEKKMTGLKFGQATQDYWVSAFLRYIQNLLNYSANYFDYLTGEQEMLNNLVIINAYKTGFSTIAHFTVRDAMEWLYGFLPLPADSPKSKEDDINDIIHATNYEHGNRPFINFIRKYSDDNFYDVLTGKVEHPGPPDED